VMHGYFTHMNQTGAQNALFLWFGHSSLEYSGT
jgi:hypothetical protein